MSNSKYKEHLYALIVAGGGGTRLWPRSTNKTPKQFLPLFNKRTLTQITAYRYSKILPWEKIFVVTTTNEYKKEMLREVPEFIPRNIIVEPFRRNSGPAHGLGALVIFEQDPDAVVLNESADHLVNPEQRYFRTMLGAAEAAYGGDWLVATGIKPTYPNIGYGYVKRGNKFGVFNGKILYKLDKFTEKPSLEVAKDYIASGDYFWHANEFVWRADSILKAIREYEPAVGRGLDNISGHAFKEDFDEIVKREYERMPEISIEYAVGEKAKNFLLVTADYNWTDIGDWNEVWTNLTKDSNGNVIISGDEPGGEVINIDTSDALIHTDGRLIAIIDVDNIAVVDTKEVLLICAKSRAQNVKKIVEQLKAEKRTELL